MIRIYAALVAVLLSASPARGQSVFIGQAQTMTGAATPTSCALGQMFTTTAGDFYVCTAANTWSEFGGGGAVWGSITGTLSDQTDLQTALDAKAALDSPVFTDDFDLAAAGVRFAAADGVLTLTGLGNGNDENLTWDFDNAAANTVAVASGTGVATLTFAGMALSSGTLRATDGTRVLESFLDATGAWWGTTSNHALQIFTNNSAAQWTFATTGVLTGSTIVLNTDAAGTRLTGIDGIFVMLGQSNGNDEDLRFDLDNAASNVIGLSSTTGVTKIDAGNIIFEGKFNSSDGTAGVTVTTCTGFKDGLCISGT